MASPRWRYKVASSFFAVAVLVLPVTPAAAASERASATRAADAPAQTAPSTGPTSSDAATAPGLPSDRVSVQVVSATPAVGSARALPNGTAPFCYPPAYVNYSSASAAPAMRTAAPQAVSNAGAKALPQVMQPFPSVASGNAISGRVLGTGGLPLRNVVVFASVYGYYNYAYTAADGTYSVDVPYYGSYLMCFDTVYASDANGRTNYLSGYYKQGIPNSYIGQADVASLVPVDSSPVGGVNLTLPVGHTISGHVIGMAAVNLAGVSVKAYTGAYIGWGTTNVSGNYSITVPSETFRVKFYSGDSGYLSVYYKAGAMGSSTIHEDQASVVTVGSANVTGISVQLQTGYHLSGRITGDGGASLGGRYVWAASSLDYCADDCFTTTADDGTYSLTLVPDDTIKLGVRDPDGRYLNGFYRASAIGHFTISYALASPFHLLGDVTGVFLQMGRNHYIGGTVKNLNGVSLGGVKVAAVNDTGDYCGTTSTAANGTYSLDVPNDTYKVFFGGDCRGSMATVVGGLTYLSGWFWITDLPALDWARADDVAIAGADNGAISVRLLQPWRVTVSATSTTVRTGKTVQVTATVNQSAGLTPWYLSIRRNDGLVLASAGAALSVTHSDSRSSSGAYGYRAVMGGLDGTTDIQAESSQIAVKWYQSTYHPIAPVRLLDTRTGNGHSGKLTAGVPITFKIAARADASPQIPNGASAVTGNLTVTGSSAGWAVYLGPSPVVSPASSTINFIAGQTIANGLTVALSASGYLAATYMGPAGATTHLVFDVTGYYTPNATGQTYHPIGPQRFVDSRSSIGLSNHLTASTPACFGVAGLHGLPVAAKAVTGNVTVANSTSSWALYLGPTSTSTPATSTLNFLAGEAASNNVTVALNGAGKLCATYLAPAGATTDLIFDVTGYYTADATGMVFVPVSPVRLLDTRSGNGLTGKFTAATPRTFTIAGRGTVPAVLGAVTGNLTVTNASAGWAIYAGPTPLVAPATSSLNFVVGEVRANGLSVALSAGKLSATYLGPSGATTDLVFDLTGLFIA